jgi:hypothetical protein
MESPTFVIPSGSLRQEKRNHSKVSKSHHPRCKSAENLRNQAPVSSTNRAPNAFQTRPQTPFSRTNATQDGGNQSA